MKTGEQISPPNGYVGGGLQMQTDLAIDPARNVWVMNNWQDIDSCFGVPPEPLSTRCGGQSVVVFYGMAKPVRAPRSAQHNNHSEPDSPAQNWSGLCPCWVLVVLHRLRHSATRRTVRAISAFAPTADIWICRIYENTAFCNGPDEVKSPL